MFTPTTCICSAWKASRRFPFCSPLPPFRKKTTAICPPENRQSSSSHTNILTNIPFNLNPTPPRFTKQVNRTDGRRMCSQVCKLFLHSHCIVATANPAGVSHACHRAAAFFSLLTIEHARVQCGYDVPPCALGWLHTVHVYNDTVTSDPPPRCSCGVLNLWGDVVYLRNQKKPAACTADQHRSVVFSHGNDQNERHKSGRDLSFSQHLRVRDDGDSLLPGC